MLLHKSIHIDQTEKNFTYRPIHGQLIFNQKMPRKFKEEKDNLSASSTGTTGYPYMQKNGSDPYLTLYTKINLK